jgi:glucosylceramidase
VTIDGWITHNAGSLLQRMEPIAFSAGPPQNDYPTIEVDREQAFQPIEGFGFAMTGGSASLIAGLAPATRAALLQELFGTDENAIGLSCLRLSIGASDMGIVSFSYCDLPPEQTDPALASFNLAAGDPELVAVLQQILRVNPDIKFIAAPWSAPPWMKTNGSFVAGRLKPEFYSAYAQYFVKYIEAMRSHGIRISAVSPQNEPCNPKNEPSLLMSAAEQADFIKNHLGPALRQSAPDTGILTWDHNCDRPDYPLAVLGDDAARGYISGVAWHLYAGSADVMSQVRDRYPEQNVYFTEQWISSGDGFEGALRWHTKNVLIGALRNWSRTVIEWNLASDPACSLHTPGGAIGSLGGITIGDDITRNAGYYLMAHAAKFIRPGSMRVHSTGLDQFPNVACLTTDDHVIMVVMNDQTEKGVFNIFHAGASAIMELDAGAVATLRWREALLFEKRSKNSYTAVAD